MMVMERLDLGIQRNEHEVFLDNGLARERSVLDRFKGKKTKAIAAVLALSSLVACGRQDHKSGEVEHGPKVTAAEQVNPHREQGAEWAAPRGDYLEIKTASGDVRVKNFYKTDKYVTQDHETVVLAENENYSISYYAGDEGFIITLFSADTAAARTAAESELLDQLGVSRDDALKLNVNERILNKNSPDDGKLMGLSFHGDK